jgi:hypothetical protein
MTAYWTCRVDTRAWYPAGCNRRCDPGRYTHRVAISNNRLKQLKDGQVTFTYKDYKHEQRHKVMTVSADEFLRRFLLHVLPDSFQPIRHDGLLGNRHRAQNLGRCRELLAMPAPIPQPERN